MATTVATGMRIAPMSNDPSDTTSQGLRTSQSSVVVGTDHKRMKYGPEPRVEAHRTGTNRRFHGERGRVSVAAGFAPTLCSTRTDCPIVGSHGPSGLAVRDRRKLDGCRRNYMPIGAVCGVAVGVVLARGSGLGHDVTDPSGGLVTVRLRQSSDWNQAAASGIACTQLLTWSKPGSSSIVTSAPPLRRRSTDSRALS